MGGCTTKEEVQARLAKEEAVALADYENSQKALAQLDSKTRVPHLLIEVRSLGYVEIQGKNIGGIYERLHEWLTKNWRVQKLETDLLPVANDSQDCYCCGYGHHLELHPLPEHHRLCDMSYTFGEMQPNGMPTGNGVYQCRGKEGENNMGKLTMQLVQYMTNECGWTFQVCDSGNLGYNGEIREQQMKFKAPHPLNLIAPHIMIELRQVGYVEVNGPDTEGIHEKLGGFLTSKWKCSKIQADAEYCDLKYSTSGFKKRGEEGENNMGQRTMELVDFMVKECAWTMVTCSGGNFGRTGDKREQQLVFRNDEFVQHGVDHVMVELRTSEAGYIEVNGMHDAQDLQPHLIEFLKGQWRCTEYKPYFWEDEKYCELKYTCPKQFYYQDSLTNNLGKLTIQLSEFMSQRGWALLLCNGGSLQPSPDNNPNNIIREQQIKFTRAKTQEKAVAPLLMIELRTQPYSDGSEEPIAWAGFIEINGRNTNGVHEELHKFITEQMDGQLHGENLPYADRCYTTPKFRLKPSQKEELGRRTGLMMGESNLGKWTMRMCDFMVDHLGEWDLIVCNSDNLSRSWGGGAHWNSVTAREMQLVFRHRPGGRAVFMSTDNAKPLGRPPLQPPPYWTDPGCISGGSAHKLLPGTKEELAWMQEVLDKTYKSKVTRDRRDGQPLADRFVAVQCIRSEHPELWDRFAERRKAVADSCRGAEGEFVQPKTMACDALVQRCTHAAVGNPANQAYLLHGTNPTSAVAILGRSFTIDFAGKSAGTMFGPGVYLAESSTKADEYARDDVGGEYDGLYAVLVCRAVLGRSYVTEKAGDFRDSVLSGEYGHVLGDREKAVGTFREFILFHEASIYPEYAVFYRREKDGQIMEPVKGAEPPGMERMEGEGEEEPQQ